ncbi:MAG: hypothetical protein Q9227_005465 [Pyrenula ochraceoflavens]
MLVLKLAQYLAPDRLAHLRHPARAPLVDLSHRALAPDRSQKAPRARQGGMDMLEEIAEAAVPDEGRKEAIGVGATVGIVVEKLTKNVTEAHLREIFGNYGDIQSIDLPMNRQCTWKAPDSIAIRLTHPVMTNRGTAYIVYYTSTDAEQAISHMHEAQLDGTVINTAADHLLHHPTVLVGRHHHHEVLVTTGLHHIAEAVTAVRQIQETTCTALVHRRAVDHTLALDHRFPAVDESDPTPEIDHIRIRGAGRRHQDGEAVLRLTEEEDGAEGARATAVTVAIRGVGPGVFRDQGVEAGEGVVVVEEEEEEDEQAMTVKSPASRGTGVGKDITSFWCTQGWYGFCIFLFEVAGMPFMREEINLLGRRDSSGL